MKLNLINIKKIKQDTENKLTKRVCNYVINHWQDYTDKKDIFTDVLYHGCVTGIVSELIYYSDTVRFYKQYKSEINELLYETMQNCGFYSCDKLFRNMWNEEDPLANEQHNQNLLAWFGFEETLRNIGLQFETLQDCI